MKLVFLIYASNNCYVEIVKKIPNNITVDVRKRTWSYNKKIYNIGEMRYCEHSRYGIIGVYDMGDIAHINNIAHHAIEATRNYKQNCY